MFDNAIQRRWNSDGEKKFVYRVPIENGDLMYSTVKGCNDDECAYQWRSEDDVIFVQYMSAITSVQHDSCDVAMQEIFVHEWIVINQYISIRCESAHVLMYAWRVPNDEVEAIIASVAILE